MKTLFVISCFIGCSGITPLLAGPAEDFEQANRSYLAGDFKTAAAQYTGILATEGHSAELYYNLGNSYQSLKQYGPAILAYERARLITPRDPDLLANLSLARKAAAAFEVSGRHPHADAVLNFLSRNEWSWLVAGCAMFLGGLSMICGAGLLRRRGAGQAAAISAGVAVSLLIAASVAVYLRRSGENLGIVLSENAAVHLSPFENAESLGTPGPGRTVRLTRKSGSYHYIEVPGSNLRGWLSDKEVERIIPMETR